MTLDLDTLFPEGISDEAAYVLCEAITELALALESHYFVQQRRYLDAPRPERDPEQPWKTTIKE